VTVRALFLTLLVACHTAKPPPPAPPDPSLERFDVFGSRQLSRDQVIARWGAPLAKMMAALEQGDQDGAMAIGEQILVELRAAAALAHADFDVITYFQPRATYVTLDLVDEADRAARMTFLAAPTGQVPDPDGLLALWGEYEDAMWPVLEKTGGAGDPACPAWHCITFGDPTLTPYAQAFEARVPAQEAALAQVLAEDADEVDRARAAFLLAHLDDGDRVVELELPAFRDPSPLVRNNAMRVLAIMADQHREIAIPLPPVLEAIRFPTTTDRNKAAAILAGLATRPEHHDAIADGAGEVLVEMLGLRQPNNHDFAYQILKAISGQGLGERDLDAWRRWLSSR
jgi:hypothetical protein